MPRVFVSGTILAGQSLSAPIDCRTGTPLLLFMPAQWTPARISYLLSQDGVTFYDLYDRSAKEIAVNVRAGTVVRLNPEWTDRSSGLLAEDQIRLCGYGDRAGRRPHVLPAAQYLEATIMLNRAYSLLEIKRVDEDARRSPAWRRRRRLTG